MPVWKAKGAKTLTKADETRAKTTCDVNSNVSIGQTLGKDRKAHGEDHVDAVLRQGAEDHVLLVSDDLAPCSPRTTGLLRCENAIS